MIGFLAIIVLVILVFAFLGWVAWVLATAREYCPDCGHKWTDHGAFSGGACGEPGCCCQRGR